MRHPLRLQEGWGGGGSGFSLNFLILFSYTPTWTWGIDSHRVLERMTHMRQKSLGRREKTAVI